MKCVDVEKNLSAYIDDELDKQKASSIGNHLNNCKKCRENYEKLNIVDEVLVNLFEPIELPNGFREQLINKSRIAAEHELHKGRNVKYNNIKEWITMLLTRKAIIRYGVIGLGIILLLIGIGNEDLRFNISHNLANVFSKSTHKEIYFRTIEAAKEYIKDIPVVNFRNIKSSYKLKEIVYYPFADNRDQVDFYYRDRDDNELRLSYSSKEDAAEANSDIRLVSPNIIKIETDTGMGLSQYNTSPTGNTALAYKKVAIDLPKYKVDIQLSYNGGVDKSDASDNEMLIKIAEDFLQSDIFDAANENDIIFDSITSRYNSFAELQKNIPNNIIVTEPQYIPEGFSMKYVTLKYYKENPPQQFNVTATYENKEGMLIAISYQTSGESGIHDNNNNQMQLSDVFRIQCDGKGKGYLVPYIEKYLPYRAGKFDLHIYMQYGIDKIDEAAEYDKEIEKIVGGIR